MKNYVRTIVVAAVSLMGGEVIPTLKADDWNRKTNITIDQSIDIQGTVLPPGSYVIKLLDSTADRHVVQIFNADENHLIAMVLAISAYRENAGDTDFQFYATADGRPRALHTWFYPGDNFGFEFRADRKEAAVQTGHRHTIPATSNAGVTNN